MRNKEGYTPREQAYDIVIGWIYNVHHEYTQDISHLDSTESFKKEVKKQLAKIHNKLLEKANLDGVPLDDKA